MCNMKNKHLSQMDVINQFIRKYLWNHFFFFFKGSKYKLWPREITLVAGGTDLASWDILLDIHSVHIFKISSQKFEKLRDSI